ncbi:hypothetical protein [Clostridium botulinum]
MGNFDWNEFKKGKVVVHCDTKEKAINFLSECNLQNIKWVDKEDIIPTKCYFEKYETGIGYRFVPFESNEYCHGLTYDCLEFYETIGSNIIEWEIENKIDYDGIYTFMEVINNIKNNEKWISIDTLYTLQSIEKVENHIVFNYDGNMSNKSLTIDINTRFKLVKKDKKVTFEEAIQAYNEYKTIKCIWLDYIYEFQYQNNEANLINLEEDRLLNLILEGEWYIKED